MSDEIIQIADDFWNIRGSFRVFGINLGTQSSLVRRASGGFLLLDAYTLEGDVKERVLELTDGGEAIEAVILLHPFHTVHVKRVAKMFPAASLYGTSRHVSRAPDLRWEAERTESAEFADLFDDLEFTVPPGVEFVPDDQNLHFASVLAHHTSSGTLHVDDTLSYTQLPIVGGLRFHPSLKQVLRPEPGAAARFRVWAEELAERCESVEQIVTAHGPTLPPSRSDGFDPAAKVRDALRKVERTLENHKRKHG